MSARWPMVQPLVSKNPLNQSIVYSPTLVGTKLQLFIIDRTMNFCLYRPLLTVATFSLVSLVRKGFWRGDYSWPYGNQIGYSYRTVVPCLGRLPGRLASQVSDEDFTIYDETETEMKVKLQYFQWYSVRKWKKRKCAIKVGLPEVSGG